MRRAPVSTLPLPDIQPLDGPRLSTEPGRGTRARPRLAEGWGWYLYGITCADPGDDLLLDGEPSPLPLPCGDLMAIVRPVVLAEYELETLRARAGCRVA